ncbi:MAG TPA: ferrochelatase [Actinomycetota bacterium]|nr:ferrochelatase [Actinomycetota bacterium]
MSETALLVMAYGTPAGPEAIEPYYTHIRRGLPPPQDLLEELTARYAAIGGSSPLLEITRAQAAGLARRVPETTAFVGQKHAPPFIEDAVADIVASGIDRACGVVLAPHYSTMSIEQYKTRARNAFEEQGWDGHFDFVDSWHLERGFITFLAQRVREAIDELPPAARAEAVVLFTAHSLPERILTTGDPYPSQLRETAEAVAAEAGLTRWDIAWQSAGRTKDPWIGPDILDVIDGLARDGVPGAVICPCGFVADHLEVLYDVDIEAAGRAEVAGIHLVRTSSPNDDPVFLDALAAAVARAT